MTEIRDVLIWMALILAAPLVGALGCRVLDAATRRYEREEIEREEREAEAERLVVFVARMPPYKVEPRECELDGLEALQEAERILRTGRL